MHKHFNGAGALRLTLTLALAVAVAACTDSGREPMLSPSPTAEPARLSLAVERLPSNDSTYAVILRLQDGSPLTRIGSVVAAVYFDTTTVRFVGDSSPAGDAMRASRPDGGVVRIAAATASALDPDHLARLVFVARDSSAIMALRLQLLELHKTDAADLSRSVTVAPPALTRATP